MKGNNPNFQTIVEDGRILRFLFSMHSSLEELQDFVSCLRPDKITPIARPDGVSSEEVITYPIFFTLCKTTSSSTDISAFAFPSILTKNSDKKLPQEALPYARVGF